MFGEADHELLYTESSSFNVTGVFWAIPVKPDLLGARLEAYHATQKAMHSVRLCHRFGTSACAITKLPTEILDIIELYVQAPLRREFEEKWAKAYNCATGACEIEDHFAKEFRIKLELQSVETDACECGCCQGLDCDIVQDQMLECNEMHNAHMERAESWLDYFDQVPGSGGDQGGAFVKLDKTLKKCFGLEAFLSNQRLEDEESSIYPILLAAFAFLTLPGEFTSTLLHVHASFACGASSLILPPEILKPLAAKDAAKFQKALRTLDLKPWISPLQFRHQFPSSTRGRGPNDKVSAREERIRDLENQEWPQRVVLTKNEEFFDF